MFRTIIFLHLSVSLISTALSANETKHRYLRAKDPEWCVQKYGNRTLVPLSDQKIPPVLWTFPGSGSGWTRLLIEHATGHLSGTVYGDESLLPEFPGEYKCNNEVSCIKAHPTTHSWVEINGGILKNHRCKVGKMTKAIMIIRNPFDAIFSDHNRKITRSHVGKIKRADFNKKEWFKNARRLALLYNDMWTRSYNPFMKRYPNGYVVVRYEDLLNKDIRNEWLAKVLDLMDYSYTDERLDCAFYLANHPKVKRPVRADDVITKEEAYSKSLVCDIIWPIVKRVSEEHGYGIYRGMVC